jgi:EAL domain-containing protein (putative c-di-GMP-specific phosphodiesterase class I)
VAEGIERPEQLRTLKALGCDVGQGYLLSAPLEADELDRCLGAAAALAVT